MRGLHRIGPFPSRLPYFGKTIEEAIEMAKEAIEGYIETLINLGKEVPTGF